MATEKDTKDMTLRIPNDLHARLVPIAKRNHRSLQAQILATLEELADREETKGSMVRREGRNTPAHLPSEATNE